MELYRIGLTVNIKAERIVGEDILSIDVVSDQYEILSVLKKGGKQGWSFWLGKNELGRRLIPRDSVMPGCLRY